MNFLVIHKRVWGPASNRPLLLNLRCDIKATGTTVSVARTSIGDIGEHWMIFIHADNGNSGMRYHAVGVKAGAPLTTKGETFRFSPKPGSTTTQTTTVGPLLEPFDVLEAGEVLEKIHLTENYPEQNCVDYTFMGLKAMVASKMIAQTDLTKFQVLHSKAEIEGIREKTTAQLNIKISAQQLQSSIIDHPSESAMKTAHKNRHLSSGSDSDRDAHDQCHSAASPSVWSNIHWYT